MEGDPLTLDCVIEGKLLYLFSGILVFLFVLFLGANEEVELTWLRNNKEIPENPDFRREHEGNVFKLVVTEV
jgi:hypothetical protein